MLHANPSFRIVGHQVSKFKHNIPHKHKWDFSYNHKLFINKHMLIKIQSNNMSNTHSSKKDKQKLSLKKEKSTMNDNMHCHQMIIRIKIVSYCKIRKSHTKLKEQNWYDRQNMLIWNSNSTWKGFLKNRACWFQCTAF